MYAIIETGGKQYRVSEGDVIKIEKIEGEPNSEYQFEKVLFLKDNGNFEVGSPYLENIKVVGEILETKKDKKIIVFKYKRRKNYRRKKGHRQWYTKVKIKQIIREEV